MVPSRLKRTTHTKKMVSQCAVLIYQDETSVVFTFWTRLCASNQQGWKQRLQLYKNETLQQVKCSGITPNVY